MQTGVIKKTLDVIDVNINKIMYTWPIQNGTFTIYYWYQVLIKHSNVEVYEIPMEKTAM